MKILLAVDGSKYTKKMLAYLTTHDSLFTSDNEYTIFTAQPALPPRARAAVGKMIVDKYHSEEAEKILGPVSKYLLRHGLDAKSQWTVGPAGVAIAKSAKSGKFDLVLMGSHGHGTIATLVLGSVATQVLALCSVPVLLIR
jgi:nucleotide-binding universal stress UspA family protein